MEPFEVYKLYLALKLHFTSKKYDITKTNGAVRANYESFLKRKDLVSIHKIAREYKRSDVIELLVSNFILDNCANIYDKSFAENHTKWLTRRKRLLYTLDTDLDNILFRMEKDGIESALEGQHPLIFRMYMGGDIKLESLVIIEKLYPFIRDYETDFVLEDLCMLIHKYNPFVRVDKEIVKQKFSDKILKCLNH